MGLSVPLRIVPVPPPQARPPTQLLAVLLPYLPKLPVRSFRLRPHPTGHAVLARTPSLAARELRPADGAHARDGPSARTEEAGSGLCVVRPDVRVCRVQQGVHVPGTYARLFLFFLSFSLYDGIF